MLLTEGGGVNVSYKPLKCGFGYPPLFHLHSTWQHFDTMGSSQSRPNESNRHSRVGDQLKSALRRPGPSAQRNNGDGDDEKPQSAGVAEQVITNGNHDDTSTPETGQKRASGAQLQRVSMPVTVPCQYRTGKTLGSGTYAIVKEAIHVETGKYFACKVINKKLMEGREHMVRNEIAVLKRISSGHRNIVTLHDYFETSHNLYLCFDLCTGGELFDRICAKGNYYEADASSLVRTIFKAVKYIHDSGIVHRDLKPENLLFRTTSEDADIMLADFGLSRIMEEEKLNLLTEICGTPGYMAPEIFKKSGHGKPVDIWAMGVITYFLLAGYTPFDRESQQLEMEAIIAGDYKFEPDEYWQNVSPTAKDFVRTCLTIDPAKRPTAAIALQHKWLTEDKAHFVTDTAGAPADLLPNMKKNFNAKKLWRKAAFGIRAVNRMATLAHIEHDTGKAQMREDIYKYKEESAKETLENAHVTYQQKKTDDISVDSNNDLLSKMAKASLDDKKSPS